MNRPRGLSLWSLLAGAGVVAVAAAAGWTFRGDIEQELLNPAIPYAVYKPPPTPDYAEAGAWALAPGDVQPSDPPADVFFIHPTTFNGGRDWNGPIADRGADFVLSHSVLPNYAAPFAAAGRLFAPRYRQASIYTLRTMFDDAVEARAFAYTDVKSAFEAFLKRTPADRPILIVGVEQGGLLASRLLSKVIAADPAVRRRLVGAWLIETAVPADLFPPTGPTPACARRAEAGCVVAWISAPRLDFIRSRRIRDRSLVWNETGRLTALGERPILCVNPLLGEASEALAPERLNQGAVNGTDLELTARPAFMVRQVSAQCIDGILRLSRPRSTSLQPRGSWVERLRVPSYNLVWADLEADAQARLAAWRLSNASPTAASGHAATAR